MSSVLNPVLAVNEKCPNHSFEDYLPPPPHTPAASKDFHPHTYTPMMPYVPLYALYMQALHSEIHNLRDHNKCLGMRHTGLTQVVYTLASDAWLKRNDYTDLGV
ncbi:hypothetical protein RRG08_001815 [Elysia crispata]|uniref:Uncharacterized protein n=1 Tax=Elysia crispata TaxID=231223 RepID=A0AAE1CU88_9GAST|nr:hypothetical protein RRG08_001815 [Elysia crispata]